MLSGNLLTCMNIYELLRAYKVIYLLSVPFDLYGFSTTIANNTLVAKHAPALYSCMVGQQQGSYLLEGIHLHAPLIFTLYFVTFVSIVSISMVKECSLVARMSIQVHFYAGYSDVYKPQKQLVPSVY